MATAPELRFWGVRGSIARPGDETLQFGGNTACIEVVLERVRAGVAPSSTIIIDAGTGIAPLGRSRTWKAGQRVDLLLTHLHHDHIVGLPFFGALLTPGLDLHIWCGNLDGESARESLLKVFTPPLFPLSIVHLPAQVTHHGFRAGETIDIAGFRVRTLLLNHPAGSTAYRFDTMTGSAAIITDLEHEGTSPAPDLAAFCGDVDTIVYDMMIEDRDYERFRGWGHSTAAAGIELARTASARRLVGFHHAPFDDDVVMAERERLLKAGFPNALMARDGMNLKCGGGANLAGQRPSILHVAE